MFHPAGRQSTPAVPASLERRELAMACGDAGRFSNAENLLSQSARFLLDVDEARALIDARARELPLPPGCAGIASQLSHRVIWQDTLSVLAVLAKCSDTLWLRDKNPSLSSALSKSRVSLLVPALFVPHLPKVPS